MRKPQTPDRTLRKAENAAIAALTLLAARAESEQCRLLAARALLEHVTGKKSAAAGAEKLGKKDQAKRDAQAPDTATEMGALMARRAKQGKKA